MPRCASSNRPWRCVTASVKAPRLVAEQLALDERRRQRGAVDADDRRLTTAAARVQRPCEQLLARAGFSEQQCRAVGLSHFLQQPERCAQRRAVSDDVLESDDRGARRHDGRLGTFTQPRPQTRDFNVGVVEHLLDPSPRERRGDDSCDGPQPFDHLVRPAARLIHEPGGQRARPHTVETRHDQTDDHGRPQRHPRQRLLGDGGQIVDRQIVRDAFDGEGFPSVVPPVDQPPKGHDIRLRVDGSGPRPHPVAGGFRQRVAAGDRDERAAIEREGLPDSAQDVVDRRDDGVRIGDE